MATPGFEPPSERPSTGLVRVVGYNVRSFRTAGVGKVAEATAGLEPDLLLLQECGSKGALRRFARIMDMQFVSTHRPFRRVRNAVLYPSPWRLTGFEVRDFPREGRTIRRGFVAASLRRPGLHLTAVAAHLGLAGRERRRHARQLTDFLAGVDGSVVLAVDLNEGPDAAATRWIADRLYDAFGSVDGEAAMTFPARTPTTRIDYLFVRDGLRVERAWVPQEPLFAGLSDHRPVVADLEFPGG
jgi:endonuclease/exonuclease/phosphatase family metal-dependent hydrolase